MKLYLVIRLMWKKWIGLKFKVTATPIRTEAGRKFMIFAARHTAGFDIISPVLFPVVLHSPIIPAKVCVRQVTFRIRLRGILISSKTVFLFNDSRFTMES
jgi:hypothetical protein